MRFKCVDLNCTFQIRPVLCYSHFFVALWNHWQSNAFYLFCRCVRDPFEKKSLPGNCRIRNQSIVYSNIQAFVWLVYKKILPTKINVTLSEFCFPSFASPACLVCSPAIFKSRPCSNSPSSSSGLSCWVLHAASFCFHVFVSLKRPLSGFSYQVSHEPRDTPNVCTAVRWVTCCYFGHCWKVTTKRSRSFRQPIGTPLRTNPSTKGPGARQNGQAIN